MLLFSKNCEKESQKCTASAIRLKESDRVLNCW